MSIKFTLCNLPSAVVCASLPPIFLYNFLPSGLNKYQKGVKLILLLLHFSLSLNFFSAGTCGFMGMMKCFSENLRNHVSCKKESFKTLFKWDQKVNEWLCELFKFSKYFSSTLNNWSKLASGVPWQSHTQSFNRRPIWQGNIYSALLTAALLKQFISLTLMEAFSRHLQAQINYSSELFTACESDFKFSLHPHNNDNRTWGRTHQKNSSLARVLW